MINDDIDILILDHLHDSLKQDQEKELKKWIESSEENRTYFARTIAYLETTASMGNHQQYPSVKAWPKLRRKINPGLARKQLVSEFSKIAAVFVLAFFLGYLFLYLRHESEQESLCKFVITEVPYGSKSVVSLPDGSRVWINAGSKIKYSPDFNENDRSVALEGEAYFDLVTDKKKPFFVETSGIKVKATGTQFNVRAYPDEEFIETTLVEGVVSVMPAVVKNGKEYVLHPNQKLTIYRDRSGLPVKTIREKRLPEQPDQPKPLQIKKIELESDVSTAVYTSWKDKEWIIYKEKFGTLAKKLEKRYDVQISFRDDFIAGFSYTGTLKDENLKEVLDVMSLTSPINYELENKNVTIWYDPAFNERN